MIFRQQQKVLDSWYDLEDKGQGKNVLLHGT